jgi:general secretion pathway protein K
MRVRPGEGGYAMVAAVAGIAVMAMIAATLVQFTSQSVNTFAAETARAKALAATDAGVQIALGGLLRQASGGGFIDGQVHRLRFATANIEIRVEDERGKIMLNRIDEENIVWLLEALGVQGDRLAVARDSFLDWIDQDEIERPDGAESDYYAPRGIKPRNDGPHTIDEMSEIRGFTPDLVERFRRLSTVDSGNFAFDPRFAHPLSIAVMTDGQFDSPAILERKRELAGQRTAISLDSVKDMTGRVVTIVATAKIDNGGTATRRVIVELTGSSRAPYVIRSAS